MYLMRRPRALWRSLPRASPQELFDEFLELRGQMVEDLELEVLSADTEEDYFAHERLNNDQRKQVVRRRSSLGILLEMWLFDQGPKKEWLGEYASRAKKEQKHKEQEE
jgi:hypothetical protein